jgi:hypothetical protein
MSLVSFLTRTEHAKTGAGDRTSTDILLITNRSQFANSRADGSTGNHRRDEGMASPDN